jgi:hypothetical protein
VVTQATERIRASLNALVDDLATALRQTVADASSLEVLTYVCDDLTRAANSAPGQLDQVAVLRAVTRVGIDGDTVVMVPEDAGEVDATLWAIHADMVARAQVGRAELIQTAASAVGGLLKAI